MGFLKKAGNFIVNILSKNFLAFLLILIAAFLRFYRLNEFVTFLGDQGRDAIIIKRIITLEHFPAIGAPTSIGQIFLGPFYYYLMAPFLLLFNFNPYSLAFGVCLLSIIATLGSYFIVKKHLNKITALIFLAMIVFSSALIELSRFSWNPNLLPFFAFLSLYFMALIIKKDKIFYYIILGALLSISTQLHYLGIFLFFPLIFIFIYKFKIKKQKFVLGGIVSGVFSCLLFSSPLILFDLKHGFLNSKNFINLIFKKDIVSQESLLIRILETNKQFYSHIFNLEFNRLIGLILTLILVFLSLRLIHNIFVKINLVNFLGFMIAFSFLNSSRYPHYYGQIYLSFFFLVTAIIFSLKNKTSKLVFMLFLILYLGLNIKNYKYFIEKGSFQINRAKKIAETFDGKITSNSFLVMTEPFTESADPVKYFLEIKGFEALPENYPGQPDEFFLMCYLEECTISGNPQWQLSAFRNPKIDKIWKVEGIKIYKLVHGK